MYRKLIILLKLLFCGYVFHVHDWSQLCFMKLVCVTHATFLQYSIILKKQISSWILFLEKNEVTFPFYQNKTRNSPQTGTVLFSFFLVFIVSNERNTCSMFAILLHSKFLLFATSGSLNDFMWLRWAKIMMSCVRKYSRTVKLLLGIKCFSKKNNKNYCCFCWFACMNSC